MVDARNKFENIKKSLVGTGPAGAAGGFHFVFFLFVSGLNALLFKLAAKFRYNFGDPFVEALIFAPGPDVD